MPLEITTKHIRNITHEDLLQELTYDPSSGVFLDKRGRIQGKLTTNGEISLLVGGKTYKASRLAWYYIHKAFPCGILKYKDGNVLNVRIDNLELIS